MKKLKLLLSFCLFCVIRAENSLTIDKTIAVIYHTEGATVVLQSDLRPGIDGMPKTLEQVILDKLVSLDGEINLKLNISEDDVDRHLIQIQKQYDMTREDTNKLFKEMGFTLDEAREQLRTRLLIDQVMEYKVKGKAIVDKKDIEEYYNAHPIKEEAFYVISQAFVPFDMGSKAIKREIIKDAIESGEIMNMVEWGAPFELKESLIASDKEFIKDLSPDTVIQLSEADEGISLLRLISKQTERLKPLEERIKEISNELGKSRFEKAFEDYKKDLFKKAHVKYIDSKS